MREHEMFVRERDPEHGAGKNGHDRSFHLDGFFCIHDCRSNCGLERLTFSSTGRAGPESFEADCARSNYLPAISGKGTRTLFACAGFVDGERAPTDFLAVERGHSGARFSVVAHGDERKAARFAGHAVHHQRDFADFAVLLEKILKIVLGSLKGEISYV